MFGGRAACVALHDIAVPYVAGVRLRPLFTSRFRAWDGPGFPGVPSTGITFEVLRPRPTRGPSAQGRCEPRTEKRRG